MKRTAQLQFIIVIAMLMLLAGTAAFGADPPVIDVTATPHNLSNSSPSGKYRGSVQEICVFCHTPHNANVNRALWNRSNHDLETGVSFHMYTAGANLTTITKQVTAPKPESLMCLSCHDGRTALNVVHRTTATIGVNPVDVGGKTMYQLDVGMYDDTYFPVPPDAGGVRMGTFGPNGMISENNSNIGARRTYDEFGGWTGDEFVGNELGDDHPISMSYSEVRNERSAGLVPIGDARMAYIKLYGTDSRVECGSCHDPHVAYSYGTTGVGYAEHAPFLRKSNIGSALCLSCHDK